jgi:hypothetical protein
MTKISVALRNCVSVPKNICVFSLTRVSFVGNRGFHFLFTAKTDKIGKLELREFIQYSMLRLRSGLLQYRFSEMYSNF